MVLIKSDIKILSNLGPFYEPGWSAYRRSLSVRISLSKTWLGKLSYVSLTYDCDIKCFDTTEVQRCVFYFVMHSNKQTGP